MTASDYRLTARTALKGKWGAFILTYLVMYLILSFCSGLPCIGLVALIFIQGPMVMGYHTSALKVMRGIDPDLNDLFASFKNMATPIILQIVNGLFIFLWSLLLIIPGIIKYYSYSMSFFVLNDNPQMTASEARAESMLIMKGYKWRLFCLDLSFIGWFLLSIPTCFVLMFWVVPYNTAARAAFYESIKTPLLIDAINESEAHSEDEWQPNADADTKGSSDFHN